ncbi:MAG: hypothetical protein HYR95_02560 [Candidatus Colwellbacteria bacterium]|nr:hypothetical protein [Candidatus Colwellbacteria bacterium]
MNAIFGVLVAALIIFTASYLYPRRSMNQEVQNKSNASATVSEPLEQLVPKPPQSTPKDANKETKNNPPPDLESFKGLDEESGSVSEATNELPGQNLSDSLKSLTQ